MRDEVPAEMWRIPVLHPYLTVPIVVAEEVIRAAPVADEPSDEVVYGPKRRGPEFLP